MSFPIVIFLGVPGSGKGTQARLIVNAYDLSYFSMGDVLRDVVSKRGDLADRIRTYTDSGALVPDSLVIELFKTWLGVVPSKGVLLDGFPRTVVQADALDKFVVQSDMEIASVVHFDLKTDVLLKRLRKRLMCLKCFNTDADEDALQVSELLCRACGTKSMSRRRDDANDDIVLKRVQTYEEQTKPLCQLYASRNILQTVDADGIISAVFESVCGVISL